MQIHSQLPQIHLPHHLIIGHDILPPELRKGINPQNALWDKQVTGSPLERTVARLVSNRGFLSTAGFLLGTYQYSRRYKQMQKLLEQNGVPPDRLVRMVFDAGGHAYMPNQADLVMVEPFLIDHGSDDESGEHGAQGLVEQAIGLTKRLAAGVLEKAGKKFDSGKNKTGDAQSDQVKHTVADEESRSVLNPEGAEPEDDEFEILPDGEGLGEEELSPAERAFDHAGIVFDFFREHLGVVITQPMVQVVDFNDDVLRTGFENAAFMPFPFGGHAVFYGKGDGYQFHSPTRAIDVVGHEFGHFYTDSVFPKKFPYRFQSGAINEHISDVIGICIKAKSNGYTTSKVPGSFWLLGAGWMVEKGMGIRHMKFPGKGFNHSKYGKDQQPAHMKKFKMTPFDAGGVHYNSGILNRIFPLFAESVDSAMYDIPLDIWKRAMEIVRPEPSFRDFAQALVQSADEFDQHANTRGQNLKDKMLAACAKTGVLDYDVVGGKVQKTA